jgi:hypothetical protein
MKPALGDAALQHLFVIDDHSPPLEEQEGEDVV